jgi:hypothetical protein
MSDDLKPRAVTFSTKRYILVCPVCGLLFDATRRDQITCSGACRVWAHRNGKLADIRAVAKSIGVTLSDLAMTKALRRLCPELQPRIRDGSLELDAAQQEVGKAFDKLVIEEMFAASAVQEDAA